MSSTSKGRAFSMRFRSAKGSVSIRWLNRWPGMDETIFAPAQDDDLSRRISVSSASVAKGWMNESTSSVRRKSFCTTAAARSPFSILRPTIFTMISNRRKYFR